MDQELVDLHRVVPHDACGDKECQTVARAKVEDVDGKVFQLIGHILPTPTHRLLNDGLPWHEARLEANVGRRAHRLHDTSVLHARKAPWNINLRLGCIRCRLSRVRCCATGAGCIPGDNPLRAPVAAQVLGSESPRIPWLRRRSRLQQTHRDILPPHTAGNVQGRPTGVVRGIQLQAALDQFSDHLQTPRPAGCMQQGRAVAVPAPRIRAEQQQPTHCGDIAAPGEDEHCPVELGELLHRRCEDGARRLATP
mmetsp:Transcript_131033/g.379103  ORF Transcript_131033/g.379103 Transcript_131033/m.379103 type:complete len:252 (-) Transcript_131033:254-1009(-)